jgi:hypothetical protein
MNSEQNLDVVSEMIVRDAPGQRVDLNHPANAFTVWAGGFFNRMQYCGSRQTLDSACLLADAHVHLKDLYVAKGPLDSFGILKFERG